MTDKLFLITEAQLKSLLASSVLTNQTENMLQSLPMVTDEPVAWMSKVSFNDMKLDGESAIVWGNLESSGSDNVLLYKSPQAITDDGSDWFYQLQFICRVLEGVDPAKQDKATALGMARSLKQTRWTVEKALTPISADDVTYKMMVECNNNADSITRADFAAAVNTWIKNRSEAK